MARRPLRSRYVHSARRVVALMRPSTFPVGSPSAANDVSKARLGEVVCVGSGTGSGGGGGSSRRAAGGFGARRAAGGFRSRRAAGGIRVAEVVVVVLAEASDGEALDGVVFTAAGRGAHQGSGGEPTGGGEHRPRVT